MPKKITPERLEQIKTVVKNNTIDNHIDDQIGHKHGWGYAAIILLRELEEAEKSICKYHDLPLKNGRYHVLNPGMGNKVKLIKCELGE